MPTGYDQCPSDSHSFLTASVTVIRQPEVSQMRPIIMSYYLTPTVSYC